jgi:hypothetical protein
MTEQFHLSRLQVINWGVFDGYHSIPFSAGGALIAGASGSGKSSLLDAISLGFLPFNRRNFNASGDNTAAGSSAGRRTVDKYDGGTSRVMYLRGDGTAIACGIDLFAVCTCWRPSMITGRSWSAKGRCRRRRRSGRSRSAPRV